MKVFVSPKYPFADAGVAYRGTRVNELVSVWSCGVCGMIDCPHIAFLGAESHGLTSYAVIAERADVNHEALVMILEADPHLRDSRTGQLEEHVHEYLEWVARETVEFASNYPVGKMAVWAARGSEGAVLRRSNCVNKRVASVLTMLGALMFTVVVSSPASATTTPVLVAHWNLDETTAGVNVADSIGTNVGVPGRQAATYPTPSASVPPVTFTDTGSMTFNGQNYFTINNPVSTDFTICAWIKTTSAGGGTAHWTSAPIMDAEVGGVAHDLGFGIGNGGKLMFGNGGNPVGGGGLYDAQVNGSTTINNNVWHNVCATRSNTTGSVNLYVDAVLDGSGITGVGALTDRGTARIGWGYDGAALYQGLIDDVRVYNGVLDANALQALTNGNSDPYTPTVSISAPTTSSTFNSWSPSVAWGTSNVCAYSYDNSSWTAVNCASNGSDISAPVSGSGLTLYVRGNLTGLTNYGTASKVFTYDAVAPLADAGPDQHVASAFALAAAKASDSISGIANVAWSKVSGPGTVTFSNAAAVNPSVTAVSQDGTYVLRLTATDNAGNTSSDDVTVIWDSTKPALVWTTGGKPDVSTSQTNATFVFSGSDALSTPLTYTCKIDSGAFVSCTSPTSINTLSQGAHTFTVHAVDAVGNVADNLAYTWTVVATQANDQNGDGIVDAVQNNVTSFASSVTNQTVALQVNSQCQVQQAAVNAQGSYAVADSGFNYPQGLFDFTVNCGANGYTTTVTQYYYDVVPTQLSLRKYNPNTHTYSPVIGATISTTNVYGQSVTTVSYDITDGGPLDDDGVQNGVIVDPAGLAIPIVVPAPVPVVTTPVATVTSPTTTTSGAGTKTATTVTLAATGATGASVAEPLGLGTALCVSGVALCIPKRRRRR